MTMSNRTAAASRAIRQVWENERLLVLEGRGSRDWTDEQQQQIIEKGKAYDDEGRAFEGQHMKCVSAYPEYQGDARNIQLLSRAEHFAAHSGDWNNPTNGYYDPVLKTISDFGDGPPQPCVEVTLTSPLYVDTLNVVGAQSSEDGSKAVGTLADTNTVPKGKWRQRAYAPLRHAVQLSKNPHLRTAVATGVSVAFVVVQLLRDGRNQDRSQTEDRIAAPLPQPPVSADPVFDDDSMSEPRKSPDEHDVSGYTRKSGTKVQPYRRGGKYD